MQPFDGSGADEGRTREAIRQSAAVAMRQGRCGAHRRRFPWQPHSRSTPVGATGARVIIRDGLPCFHVGLNFRKAILVPGHLP